MLPTFLIVGAEKAGTTTLAGMLAEHPEVYVSTPKELRFFSGPDWERGIAWYESCFNPHKEAKAVGEASPAYGWGPTRDYVPGRIARTLPDVKCVYIVRHPVRRVLSHYRHGLANRWYPEQTSLWEAIGKIPGILDNSRYARVSEMYLAELSPAQWHVMVLEDLLARPREVFGGLCDYLGVDPTLDIPLRKENAGDAQKKVPPFWQTLRKLKPLLPWQINRLGRKVATLASKPVPSPTLAPEDEQKILEALIDDTRRFGDILGRDMVEFWGLEAPE